MKRQPNPLFAFDCTNCGFHVVPTNVRLEKLCGICKRKLYGKTHPKTREQNRYHKAQQTKRIRKVILQKLGSKCDCCGETEEIFLTVDHINNDGAEHIRRLNGVKPMLYWDIQRQGFPRDKYRILCYNCNCGRYRNGGTCPHKQGVKVYEIEQKDQED